MGILYLINRFRLWTKKIDGREVGAILLKDSGLCDIALRYVESDETLRQYYRKHLRPIAREIKALKVGAENLPEGADKEEIERKIIERREVLKKSSLEHKEILDSMIWSGTEIILEMSDYCIKKKYPYGTVHKVLKLLREREEV